MADIIMIKPASGDSHAALLAGPDASGDIIESVPTGTMLKVIGSSGNFYTVAYDNQTENVSRGGTGKTGTVAAYPYAAMYDDAVKTNYIGNVNNGTGVEVIDDSKVSMLEVKALTTEGWKTGFIDAKYIFRDEEEQPAQYRMMRSSTKASNTVTGFVMPKKGLNTRKGPATSYSRVGAFNYKATVTVYESKNGWYRVSGTSGWGDLTDVWVCGQYLQLSGSLTSATVSKSDTVTVKKDSNGLSEDWASAFAAYSADSQATTTDEYYKKLAEKYLFALGAPPHYNEHIDVRYGSDITPHSGRVFTKTIMSNPSLLSICPGKVKMFPTMFGQDKDSAVDALTAAATGNSALLTKIMADDPGRFAGRLYKFEADTAEYSKYLNGLCRACAIMLGIGDELMPHTRSKLKHFDYSYWTIRRQYNPEAAEASDPDKSIFRKFYDAYVKVAKRVKDVATGDTTFINFFLNGNETSISENISNSISDSPLAGAINTVSSVGAQLNYFTGSGFDVSDADVNEALNAVFEGSGTTLSGLSDLAGNFLKGGKMVLPKMVEGSSYGKTISCNLKFMSPYGNKKSVFLRCLVPICHLLAMALPKQLSDNMYTYPFLIRCAQTGHFNVDLGIISSLTITRGGSNDTSWTTDTMATEWDVALEITPLVDQLMITSTSHPVLFCKNEMLLDYLSNFCGFDMLANNFDTKVDMMLNFVAAKFAGLPTTIENKVSDSMYNLLRPFFSAKW